VLELIAVVPGLAVVSIGARSVVKGRARVQRRERRRIRHRREAGIWWATMWLARNRGQKRLTYQPAPIVEDIS